MKKESWKVKVEITRLGGKEFREFEVDAKTEASAEKEVIKKLGNRDYRILEVTKKGGEKNE